MRPVATHVGAFRGLCVSRLFCPTEPRADKSAHWRQLVNTTEGSGCGDDAALYQITQIICLLLRL